MKPIPGRMISIMFLAVIAVALVGSLASLAIACTPEGYVEELRPDGELPGGG